MSINLKHGEDLDAAKTFNKSQYKSNDVNMNMNTNKHYTITFTTFNN